MSGRKLTRRDLLNRKNTKNKMRFKKVLPPLAFLVLVYLVYSRWDHIAVYGEDPFSFVFFALVILLLAMGIYRILRY